MSVGFGVYEIRNRKTGKVYVGQSKNPTGRWQFHVQDAFVNNKQFPLSQDMREHGLVHFDFRLLESCSSEEEAKDREKFHIAQLVNAGAPIYNILLTERLGYGAFGDDNPYIACVCRFGHVCRTNKKFRSRVPGKRAHRVTPEVFDVMQRLRALDVSLKKIAQALDLSIGIVHRYCGSARALPVGKESAACARPQERARKTASASAVRLPGVRKVGDPDLM